MSPVADLTEKPFDVLPKIVNPGNCDLGRLAKPRSECNMCARHDAEMTAPILSIEPSPAWTLL
jgi:hypothetical protein